MIRRYYLQLLTSGKEITLEYEAASEIKAIRNAKRLAGERKILRLFYEQIDADTGETTTVELIVV